MTLVEKVKGFVRRNDTLLIFGIGMVAIHMSWKELQDKKYGIVRDPSDYPHRKVFTFVYGVVKALFWFFFCHS